MFRKRVWQVRMMRLVGGFCLVKSAYLISTDLVVLKALEEEIYDEHMKLEEKVDQDYKRLLNKNKI